MTFTCPPPIVWCKLFVICLSAYRLHPFSTNARATSGLHFDSLLCRLQVSTVLQQYWIVQERKFSGGECWRERKNMMERKFPFIFVPGTKVTWTESSQEWKFSGARANVPYWELSLPGVKVPKGEKAIIRLPVGRIWQIAHLTKCATHLIKCAHLTNLHTFADCSMHTCGISSR